MKVTVITVCYNSATHIVDCIDSVKKQSYGNIEHLFIDGNSSDCTVELIKNNAKSGYVLLSEKDNGIYDAMNKGLLVASGDIIGFLNSDDVFASEFVIEKIVSYFECGSYDAIWGDLIYVDPFDLQKYIRFWDSKHYSEADVRQGYIPAHPTFYISRNALETLESFDLQYSIAADFDFMKRAILNSHIQTGYLNDLFVKMRVGGASSSNISTVIRQNHEITQSLKESFGDFSYITFLYHKITSKIYSLLRALGPKYFS